MTRDNPRARQCTRVDLAVDLVDPASGDSFIGRATNISLGGAFIQTGARPPFGAPVTLSMRLPGSTRRLPFPGVVRWSGDEGIGVQFQSLSVRQTQLIADLFVDRLQTLDGTDVAWVG